MATPQLRKSPSQSPRRFSSLSFFFITFGISVIYFILVASGALFQNHLLLEQNKPELTDASINLLLHKATHLDRKDVSQRENPVMSGIERRSETIKRQITSKSTAPTANQVKTRGKRNFRNVVIPKTIHRQRPRKQGWMAMAHGEGVQPQVIVPLTSEGIANRHIEEEIQHPDPEHILTAYVEIIDFKELETKPLPNRTTATADQLEAISFPQLNSCKKLPEMIPADQYPDYDPFLPWIHDVFPTSSGRFIQFVAQNRRRCHTGTTPEERELLHLTQPNIALFQHVPVQRINSTQQNETRYRLCNHEEADPDGIATRFICRFKGPGMRGAQETLSVYNFDYDYASHRKRKRNTFKYEDGGILSVHLSQFIFKCPVPNDLVETINSGASVVNDWATIFVDLVPIRTPPRYGLSNEFLQPRYYDRLPEKLDERFNPIEEWGERHVLPKLDDSGRWENIPICRPSSKEYSLPAITEDEKIENEKDQDRDHVHAQQHHRLVACIWASAGYTTRGNRFAINDGQRRMLEWIHYNKLLGFDHFYLYDNSYAYSSEITLKPIADLFPNDVTYIKWPFKVCNNNPNNVDSPGERSSQYAAESSCRLRFGPHADWIGQFDLDEYLVPMGNYTSVLPILDKLDQEGTKILSFGSWRAWPRWQYIFEPKPIHNVSLCSNNFACFNLRIPMNTTVLQAYNCDRQSGQKKQQMPAEKQLYRSDYVLQHFIHYSSVTVLSQMSRSEFEKAGYNWLRTKITPDPHSRFSDELEEATMLHTKAVARQDTAGWQDTCKVGGSDQQKGLCRLGFPFPTNYDLKKHGEGNDLGWKYNCYVNQKVENYWVPLLEEKMRSDDPILSLRGDQ